MKLDLLEAVRGLFETGSIDGSVVGFAGVLTIGDPRLLTAVRAAAHEPGFDPRHVATDLRIMGFLDSAYGGRAAWQGERSAAIR